MNFKVIPRRLQVRVVKRKTNDDLVDAKIFTYKLQVENHLATWTRNALLGTNVGIAIYNHGSQSIGRFVIATALFVMAWALFTYVSNFKTWQSLTGVEQETTGRRAVFVFVCALGALVFAHLLSLV